MAKIEIRRVRNYRYFRITGQHTIEISIKRSVAPGERWITNYRVWEKEVRGIDSWASGETRKEAIRRLRLQVAMDRSPRLERAHYRMGG